MEECKSVIVCTCNDIDHNIIFSYEPEWEEVFMNIHLNKLPLFGRILYAIKYIFNKANRYGAYAEFIINKKDSLKFLKVYETLEDNK